VAPARGGRGDEIDITEPIDVEVEYWSARADSLQPSVHFHAFNSEGVLLFATTDNSTAGWARLPRESGIVRSVCRIPGNFFAEGPIILNVAIATYNPDQIHAVEHDAVAFSIVDRTAGTGVRGEFAGEWPGVLRPMLNWSVDWRPGS
jgi:lipopolysaccharide transport system ATP-binding protein